MLKRTSTLGVMSFVVVLVSILAGIFWINLQFSKWGFGGKDFYVYWFGTRALIIDGSSPYSEEVISEMQEGMPTGTTILATEGNVLSAPLYSLLLSFPFALIKDFVLARAFWITSSQIGILILILILLKVTRWQPKTWVFILLIISMFFSHLAIMVCISGNLLIWTSIFLVMALEAIRINRDELAGGLLTLTTCQPQIFIFTFAFILFWAIANKRKLILVWFFGLLFILTSISLLLIPEWPLQYIRIFTRFLDFFPYVLPGREIEGQLPGIGVQLSWAITLVIIIILIVEAWLARKQEFRWLFWTSCLILVLTRLIGIPINIIHNFILIIPLILIYSVINERIQKASGWLVIIIILIFLSGWLLFVNKTLWLQDINQISMYYPLPLFLLITLYWVRWWAIRPSRHYIQEMLSRD